MSDLTDLVLLGVHRAAGGNGTNQPMFIRRDISSTLENAIADGAFVLVVGESTAGKSRAALEAIRVRLPKYTIVRPSSRTAIPSIVVATQRTRRSVVWLDDLERFLGAGGLNSNQLSRILAGPHVVVVATMRAQERERFRSAIHSTLDRSPREETLAGREVLDLATEVRVERFWSLAEQNRARQIVGDTRVVDALQNADRFGVAEYIAAGPQLHATWLDAWAAGHHPRAAALVAAAIDARRAGWVKPLPLGLLRRLHEPYIQARGGVRLRPELWDEAIAWALAPLYATTSLLVETDDGHVTVFDYLLDSVDADPSAQDVPDSVWQTLIDHSDPPGLVDLGWAAHFRGQCSHAQAAFRHAIAAGIVSATNGLSRCLGVR